MVQSYLYILQFLQSVKILSEPYKITFQYFNFRNIPMCVHLDSNLY